ncbi:MAG: hypothetical protein KJ811_03460, partial [Candidatus Margulisbacteria bacterium]|nr:hypothetical protein [Candidatus Margulisiibacteriota bacterium]
MRKGLLLIGFLVSCLLVSSVFAMGGAAPKSPVQGGSAAGDFLIDNFESGSLRYPRDWWTFDAKVEAASNKGLTKDDPGTGSFSLSLKGTATDWYVGGCGAYIAKEGSDLAKYDSIQLDIYGRGPGSGTLKIELFDDDNGNWQVEQDASNNYAPTADDKLVYNVVVDWYGWSRQVIAFEDFVDDNSGVGDDAWNPQVAGLSGGLLQMQLLCLASSA